MNKWILITLLAIVSVLSAYGLAIGKGSKIDFASKAPVTSGPFYATTPQHLLLSKCGNCKLEFLEPNVIAYEDENICSKDRRYFENNIWKMPEWIKAERDPFPEAQFPRECVALVQKSFLISAQKMKSKYLATCSSSSGNPHRGAKIHCVTRDYVNSVYNSLVDVADCLNIPQKDLIAKLSNESGLHINTFGANGDAGLGQLTGDAIGAVLEPYWLEGGRVSVTDYFQTEIKKSTKLSCQRLISYPAAFQKITLNLSQRCSLMNVPENPLRNMVYAGMFYRTLLHNIAGIKYINGLDYIETPKGLIEVHPDKDFQPGGLIQYYKMKEKLQALGIKNPNMHALTRALVMLGYNAGAGKAAIYFDVYLTKRLQAKKYLKAIDVDFLTTDFISSWQKIVGGISKTNAKAGKVLKEARKSAHTKPLPEYLMIVQDSGSPGYLSRVAQKHKLLIELMGDKRCVTEDFIHF